MLIVSDLQTYYGNIAALKGISLEVKKGEIVALLGANGAGKTTTLASISGIVPPKIGEIIYKGKNITGVNPELIVADGLIQVPEGRRIFPVLTVLDNLNVGAYLRKNKKEVAKDRDYVMSLFPILAKRKNQAGGTLSGGEQQMLAIGRALMAKPQMLLLDEPSLGLAPMIIRNIFKIIEQINKEMGTTVLLVEQNANLALQISNRAYILTNGKITLSGKSSALLNDEGVRKAYLGGGV